MPTFRIVFDDGRSDVVEDCVGPAEAIEYAMELLLDDGAEPGEEASVYLVTGDRGAEEFIATVTVPGGDE